MVSSFYEGNNYHVRPEPGTYYQTCFLWEKPSKQYPFNYFGVIPKLSDDSLLDRGQFIFDRSAGGKLVTLHKFPSPYKMAWSKSYKDADSNIVAENGGYLRTMGSTDPFMFLLTLIKTKWWPELNFGNDYSCAEIIMDDIKEVELDFILKGRYLDFDSAWDLYSEAVEQLSIDQIDDCEEDQSLLLGKDQKNRNNSYDPKLRFWNPNPEKVSLEEMDLSIRSTRCLEKSGVENLDQLLRYSKKDLKAIKNLGKRSTEEIIRFVRSYGYELRIDE